MSRFSRFLHLEKERKPGDGAQEQARAGRAERFAKVELDPKEQPAAAAAPTAQGHLARFDEVKPGALEVDSAQEVDQPFVRCASCEGDNTRFARECQHCHADLDTPAQRAFNEALWAKRREERAQEQAQHQAWQQAKDEAEVQEAKARREFYEAMARDVRGQTLRGFGDGSLGPGWLWRRPRTGAEVRLALGILVTGAIFVASCARGGLGGGLKALPLVLLMLAAFWYVRRRR